MPLLAAIPHSTNAPARQSSPHIWLDLVNNQHQVQLITSALVQVDPDGEALYTANSKALQENLQALDEAYRTTLSVCKQRTIVTSHAFFAYPAKRYGLTELAVSLSPDAEPTPRQISRLIEVVRSHGIRHIFFETLVSNRVAKVIADETGAQTLTLNPLEGLTKEEQERGVDFLDLVKENLASLKSGLGCQVE